MKQLKAAFRPLAKVSGTTILVLYALTIGVGYAAWVYAHAQNPVIPTLPEVAHAWVTLVNQGLVNRLIESITLNLEALALSSVISVGLAYLSVMPLAAPLAKIVALLRFLGFTGISFVFGLYAEQRTLQVLMLTFGIMTFFTTSMLAVVGSVPQEDINLSRTLRHGPWETVWNAVVRGQLDQTLVVLEQTAAIGWVMLTMVEGMVRSEGGIGVMLIDQNRRLQLAAVFALQITILITGFVLVKGIAFIRSILCPWSTLEA